MKEVKLLGTDEKKRYSVLPIKNQAIWDQYKACEKQIWVAEEVDLSRDDFNSLRDSEKVYLKNILSFFAISDSLVIENLSQEYVFETGILEAQYFYNLQVFIEQVHTDGYARLIDTFIKDRQEKEDMFDAMATNPAVSAKAKWAEDWISSDSFVERLVAFGLVEGLSFSSVFAGIFWYRSRGLMPGLAEMNEFIVRDETSHYEFAVHLYKERVAKEDKLSNEKLLSMVLSCYETEKEFVNNSMPDGLQGLTKDMMIQFVQFTADIILKDLGCPTYFNVKSPLEYMARIGLSNKNNFFEKRKGDYTRVDIPTDSEGMFSDDF